MLDVLVRWVAAKPAENVCRLLQTLADGKVLKIGGHEVSEGILRRALRIVETWMSPECWVRSKKQTGTRMHMPLFRKMRVCKHDAVELAQQKQML